MIKGSLLLSAPIVKHFQAKKRSPVCFGPRFDDFWGINRGFNIKFKFYNPEKAHPYT